VAESAKLEFRLKENIAERVKSGIAGFLVSLETAKYKVEEQMTELQDLRFENENLKKQVAQLKDVLEIKDETLDFRQTKLDNLRRQNELLTVDNEEMDLECENLRDISKTLQDKVQILKKRVADYGVCPPDNKLDKKLLCNANFKKIEGNFLVH